MKLVGRTLYFDDDVTLKKEFLLKMSDKKTINISVYVTCREKRDVRKQGNILQGERLKERLTTKKAIFRVLCNLITDKVN